MSCHPLPLPRESENGRHRHRWLNDPGCPHLVWLSAVTGCFCNALLKETSDLSLEWVQVSSTEKRFA